MVAGRTNNYLVFLLNKTHNRSSCHHVSSCNSFFSRRHPFSSTPTSGEDDRVVDISSSSPSSQTISYLIENCGLSSESALSVSKKFILKYPRKTDSVLQILRDIGFTNEQITALIIKCSRILSVKPDRNLKPKLEFLISQGFTQMEVVDILLSNPYVLLNSSLQRKIIPSFTTIKTIFPTNAEVIKLFKHTCHVTTFVFLANVEILRRNEVPESVIRKMYTRRPYIMARNPNFLARVIEKALDLGIHPSKPSLFVDAIFVLLSSKSSTWDKKVMFCRSLGWSREETLLVFKRQPLSFTLSNTLLKKKMDFFTQKLGLSPKRLVSYANVLRFSLEKRIIPRCSVLSLLIAKRLIKTISLHHLKISEDKFLSKFVEDYKDQVPEVVEAYNGKLDFKGLFPRWWKRPFSSTSTATKLTKGEDDRVVDKSSSSSSSSPTISYLIQNCGLSTQSAISASKNFKLKFPEKSDSVLRLLRDYGFNDKQITALITKCTRMLKVRADGNLRPKLEFLLSQGFTHPQIVEIMLNNPLLLTTSSLNMKIIPSFISIRTVLPTNDAIFQFLKHTGYLSVPELLTNVETLRSNQVPESVIRRICTKYPKTITRKSKCFAMAVEKIMDLGFEPSKVTVFANAISVLLSLKPATWERRMVFYMSLGWSHEETLLAFKRQPLSFSLSNKLIKKKMDFFTQRLGCSPSRLVSYGNLFMFSLERRIIPRCSVLNLLITKGFPMINS
ncbi:hypothetical protein ZOSMA_44G00530 [Zostera marina]|uniref:Mitochondrial transcription termination factor family protein n=1 Tax=Zostera marina TaxID=29655 RepID=A0A0K9P108_ZOSMR|nr:hypothetical protein ZOSMA_44G00530 [Zostera marina]